MEYKDIQKLIDCMGESQLSSFDIEFPDGIKISMKKERIPSTLPVAAITTTTNVNSGITVPERIEQTESKGKVQKSPMVGTFYMKPSPNADSFVMLGSKVKKGEVICIIEAMKLMNEIEAEYDGEIKEILVKDGEMVDYGKPLFVIE